MTRTCTGLIRPTLSLVGSSAGAITPLGVASGRRVKAMPVSPAGVVGPGW